MRLPRRRASKWSPWTETEVVDGSVASRLARTYIEQGDVRGYLKRIVERQTIHTACDVGSGYGRMLPILQEFSDRVVAIEREPELASQARVLYPECEVNQVRSLEKLPLPSSTVDFVLSFTVLQHLSDASAAKVACEIVRVLKPSGSVLLCEETDANHVYRDVDDPEGKFTLGRAPSEYERLFAPLQLVHTSRRRVEAGYPREDVGRYMLFAA